MAKYRNHGKIQSNITHASTVGMFMQLIKQYGSHPHHRYVITETRWCISFIDRGDIEARLVIDNKVITAA